MPAITASVTLRMSEDLLRRVDEARLMPGAARLVGVPSNLAVSRNAWLVWAVEWALEGAPVGSERSADRPPAPAEQPEVIIERRNGSVGSASGGSLPVRSAREFRPYPKGG